MTADPSSADRRIGPARIALLALLYAALLVGGFLFDRQITEALHLDDGGGRGPLMTGMIAGGLVVYVLLLALPFVPGVEIGLALLALLGARIAPAIYLATVLALLLAFGLGRLIRPGWLSGTCRRLGLTRAAALIDETAALDLGARRARLHRILPAALRPWLLRYPALVLLVLFNLPGNSLIGGGGGIAMTLGASRMISWPAYAAGLAVAVLPVPAAVMVGSWLN